MDNKNAQSPNLSLFFARSSLPAAKNANFLSISPSQVIDKLRILYVWKLLLNPGDRTLEEEMVKELLSGKKSTWAKELIETIRKSELSEEWDNRDKWKKRQIGSEVSRELRSGGGKS